MIVSVACEIPPALAAEVQAGRMELLPVSLSFERRSEGASVLAGTALTSLPVRPLTAGDAAQIARSFYVRGQLEFALVVVPMLEDGTLVKPPEGT